MKTFGAIMKTFGAILSLVFMGGSLMYEHFKHDVPTAVLMLVWAIYVRVSTDVK